MVNTEPGAPEFETSGGDLCLDLVNTLERWPALDRLTSYGSLVAWGVAAGAIRRVEAAALRRLAGRRPRAAAQALGRALEIRATLFELFSAVAADLPLPRRALARLNGWLPAAMARVRLSGEHRAANWAWDDAVHLGRVVWPVLRAAALLLTSEEGRERLRHCAARDCEWLFLDNSRNGTRRWCKMNVCGNREKARRFQQRARRRRGQ